jgi:hypothetical protein
VVAGDVKRAADLPAVGLQVDRRCGGGDVGEMLQLPVGPGQRPLVLDLRADVGVDFVGST